MPCFNIFIVGLQFLPLFVLQLELKSGLLLLHFHLRKQILQATHLLVALGLETRKSSVEHVSLFAFCRLLNRPLSFLLDRG